MHVISACLLLILAAFTYTNAITFYWAVLGCYLLGVSPSILDKKFRDHMVAFILPILAMGIFYVLYKALVASSHSSYSLVASSMYTVIAKLPIFLDFMEVSFGFWFTPNENSEGKLASNISIISLSIATISLGCIYGIRKDIEAVADFHSGKLGLVFRKYLMIAVIFILSVSPMLLSSVGAAIQMRRLQALQTISLILVLWSAKQIISHLFVRSEKVAVTVFLIVICLVGSFKANHDVRKIFVEPLSAELSYIKSEIRKGLKNSANMHIHILLSGRVSTRVDSLGFMSSSRAWPPGMVVSVIGDLAAEDDSFIKYKDTWGLGYAEDHVTSSTKDELERGLISLNRLNVIIVDLSNIEHYIDPYIVAWDSVKSSLHRGTNIFTNHTPTNDVNVTWRAMEGLSISNGDYPGFPKSDAFDGDFSSSRWGSAQTGVSIKNNAWIGFDFGLGLEKHIRHIRVRQGGAIKSGIVQQSADGVEWVTVGNVSLVTDKNIRAYHLPQSKPTRFWRLLADENMTPPSAWTVYEIQMAE